MCLRSVLSTLLISSRSVAMYVVVWVFFFLYVFFLQAEDGIRDLVRSRGLGDVYKRQEPGDGFGADPALRDRGSASRRPARVRRAQEHRGAVSYTHLTLPTSDLV